MQVFILSIALAAVAAIKPIIYIEGTMGSGKTTIINLLNDTNIDGLCLLEEPYDDIIPMLQAGNFNNDGDLALLQVHFMDMHNRQLYKSVHHNDNCRLFVVDRSIHSCLYVYLPKSLRDPFRIIYNDRIGHHSKLFDNQYIYFLDVQPSIALERVHARNRDPSEQSIKLKYIIEQYDKYMEMLDYLKAARVPIYYQSDFDILKLVSILLS